MVRGRTLMDERTARMEAAEVADEVRERIQDRNEGSGSSGSSLLSWRRALLFLLLLLTAGSFGVKHHHNEQHILDNRKSVAHTTQSAFVVDDLAKSESTKNERTADTKRSVDVEATQGEYREVGHTTGLAPGANSTSSFHNSTHYQ
mmetsp:Transcript_28837/g.55244  ORF Transcript_28837/g.55244 Transcript_28837/m.55244 type:complete len:146 (-) Transcript_28837:248-685(-)